MADDVSSFVKSKKRHAKRSKNEAHIEKDADAFPQVGRRQDIRRYMTPLWILSGVAFAVATLFLGFCLFNSAYRFHALWSTYVGIMLAIAAVFVWWHATLAEHFANTFPKESDNKQSAPLETPTPTPMKDDKPNINISSANQSGGFTGYNTGTVNLGPSPRVITQVDHDRFVVAAKSAPKGTITLGFNSGNPESHNFAVQLRQLLRDAGYTVKEEFIQNMMWNPPLYGVRLEIRDNEKPTQFAIAVQVLLKQIGIDAAGGPANRDLSDNEMWMHVGQRPEDEPKK